MMSQQKLVVGLGKTGVSCVHYLKQQGCDVAVVDSRAEPPGLAEIQQAFPEVPIQLGPYTDTLFNNAAELVVSPGVSLKEPVLAQAIARGVPVVGDIEIFAKVAQAPIIAITGSNGKTTVTTLVGEVIKAAGYQVQVCGNIGTPVLDLLKEPVPDFYVLELSSFQLETTASLKAKVAVLLNISPDHMDRYADLAEYLAAKQRIYRDCDTAVVNADEPETWANITAHNIEAFTLQAPRDQQFGLLPQQQALMLAHGQTPLVATNDLKLQGQHHWQNALVVFAIAHALAIPHQVTTQVLKDFPGMTHRCQWVANKQGADWFNDSKGTNVGATIAALTSLSQAQQGRLIWIAGGQAKHADLSPLQAAAKQYVSHAILLGEDAPLIAKQIANEVPLTMVDSLEEAVRLAASLVAAHDRVLLSPACASFDMFRNYEHRGDVFMAAVKNL